MNVKAKLTVQLLANDVVVAEVDDKHLWEQVLRAISSDSNDNQSQRINLGGGAVDSNPLIDAIEPQTVKRKGIESLAQELGVSADEVIGAYSPSLDKPYIHFDHHHWESLKKNTPERGPGTVAPLSLALTILLLWAKHEKLPSISIAMGQDVMKAFGLEDKNPARTVKNCE